ncbi:MAG TPA: GTP cyclohydrolase I, partial [Candidatus Kapabacteria bacterium]|nr:GTP cyclohydrolase I [Candidatus Kapabacteria bacterium]
MATVVKSNGHSEELVEEHTNGHGSPELEKTIHALLTQIGEDPEREGLLRTPHRVAKSWEFLMRGYRKNIKEVLNGAI